MGTKERRDRERRDLRQAILSSVRDIAARDGWQAVTIRRVADQIEYSPPTIYEHFEGKEALLGALVRDGFEQLLAALKAGTAGIDEPQARVLASAKAYWAFAWDNPELYQLMHGLGGAPFCLDAADEGKPDAAEAVYQFTVANIAGLPALRDASEANMEAAVSLLWATLHGLVSLTMSGRIKGDRSLDNSLVEKAVRGFFTVWNVVER